MGVDRGTQTPHIYTVKYGVICTDLARARFRPLKGYNDLDDNTLHGNGAERRYKIIETKLKSSKNRRRKRGMHGTCKAKRTWCLGGYLTKEVIQRPPESFF